MPDADARSIRLSACLIVRDEAAQLPDCLSSIAFCDEIVVVDSGSTDGTVELAERAGARVHQHPWSGFSRQRNVALDAAEGEWALEIDADERVTPALQREIREIVSSAPADVDNAILPLRQMFLGVPLGASALYPAGRTRLLRRDRYRHDETRAVHEGLWPAGRSAYPDGELEHILAASFREAFSDVRRYVRLEAAHLPPWSPARVLSVGILARPAVKFIYRALLLGGWRDGRAGLAKIALDCLYDAMAWAHHLRERFARRPGASGANRDAPRATASGERLRANHFAALSGYTGPVRTVAVAYGRRRAQTAHAWLRRLPAETIDAALLADSPPADPVVRVVAVPRRGPLVLLRALAAEEQRNPIEVLMITDPWMRRIAGLFPAHLRGGARPASPADDPRALVSAAQARRPHR